MQNMVPAISYLRTSRKENQKSLNSQKNKVNDFAKGNGYQIVDFYYDTASGYQEIIARPGLLRLIKRCTDGGISNIIVSDLSRLTRSLRDGILLLDWLHRHSITLHVCGMDSGVKADYLYLVSQLVEAERKYNLSKVPQKETPNLHPRPMGRPPAGYKHSKGQPGVLEKGDCDYSLASLFEQALAFKQDNPTSGTLDIAKALANQANFPNTRTILGIITNPLYTGRAVPASNCETYDYKLYPVIHYAYIAEADFNRLNSIKSRRKLYFLELVECGKCRRKVSFRKLEIYCPHCSKSLSINRFHKMMHSLCKQYIYDPDIALENRLDNMWSISQLDKMLNNIVSLGTPENNTHIFLPPAAIVQEVLDAQNCIAQEWDNLKKQLKKISLNNHDLVLHYRMRMELNDDGKGLKEFIADTFEKIEISFQGRLGSSLKPETIKPAIRKASNPLSPEVIERDLALINENIRGRTQYIRQILHDNPFLSDFITYGIVDARFKQWEDAMAYIEALIRLNPFA